MATPGIKRAWRTIRVPPPLAGVDWTLQTGGQRHLRVASLVALLTASAAAGNRQVVLQADRGGNVFFRQPASAVIAALGAVNIAAFAGAPRDGAIANTLTIPLPIAGLLLRPGDVLSVVTGALDAADQWSAIVVQAEEVPSGLDYEGDQLATLPEIG